MRISLESSNSSPMGAVKTAKTILTQFLRFRNLP